MRCPFCRYRDTRVTDSRMTDDGIRRRRQCVACGERFTTLETIQRAAVQIIKRDGRREDFNREKLLAGLRRACTKRNIPAAELEAIVAEIEAKIVAEGKPEVPSSVVGELAMDALRKLDHIAYIRFASVYRAFADLEELKEALRALEEGRVPTAEERMLQLPLIQDAEGLVPPRPRVVAGRAARRATGTDGE
ncbi:MAG: transcriptional regulator NrdR [Chloroflexota bacterium]|nr:transcriptional regulator NrdR [Dehalococcoidia bacterium]MDW8045667.1 transcriptional regulator NrdR [Chloroflexota bacterium]